MAEATLFTDQPEVQIVATDAITSGEIRQMADGRAGVHTALKAAEIGDVANFRVQGQFKVASASATTFAAGASAYWDVTANLAIPSTDAGYDAENDFYLGRAVAAKTNGQTTVLVDLNIPVPLA
jgi:predicted RecA/RadA family phage recombinase